MGRPSLPPGRYFRLLLVGYFEGLDSERGIAWRAADSLAVRTFLGLGLEEASPDHSTISRTRRLIDVETHRAVFTWVQERLVEAKLLRGHTVGIDATTLEANAAMRSIVRRDTGEGYVAFLTKLAEASGIKTPTREALARFDRKRKKKGANKEWTSPSDPDARITKMKDGRTHLAHKAEHVVDLDTGALIAVTLQGPDIGDTTSLQTTLISAAEQIEAVRPSDNPDAAIAEVVADKGYHSNDTMTDLRALDIRTYVSEPNRGRRRWTEAPDAKVAVYANRRRIRGVRGKRLLRRRGELLERPNAHLYDTGGMRRTHLRGHQNILKRLVVHGAGFNLGLLMRALVGVGKPRRLQGAASAAFGGLPAFTWCRTLWRIVIAPVLVIWSPITTAVRLTLAAPHLAAESTLTTDC
jgi:transposase